MEPILSGLISELFKKLINLFGDNLWEKLKNNKKKVRENLIDLFLHLKELEKNIDLILDTFDILLKNDNDFKQADEILSKTLLETRKIMTLISDDLRNIAPEFEIMAEETAPVVEQYLNQEMLFIDYLGLIREKDFNQPDLKEPIQKYKDRLMIIKSLGISAKKSLSEFIRKSYTWEKINE